MKKIIITGATSFIGMHLIQELLSGEYKIFAVVRKGTKRKDLLFSSEKIEVCKLDMEEYRFLPEKIAAQCDACIMLAWNGTRGKAREDWRIQEKNYKYSMECLKAAHLLGCSKVISAGSQAEYGAMAGITTEESVCAPNTAYGKAKLLFYQDAARYCARQGISFKEPRFFSLYGAHDNPQTMVISILSAMRDNVRCDLTQCLQQWNFLHIEDAVRGIRMLLEKECGDGVYNFASSDTRRLKEFIEEMYQITGSKSSLCYGALPYPVSGMVSMRPSAERLHRETGWAANVSFAEGIQQILKIMEKEEAYEKDICACANV